MLLEIKECLNEFKRSKIHSELFPQKQQVKSWFEKIQLHWNKSYVMLQSLYCWQTIDYYRYLYITIDNYRLIITLGFDGITSSSINWIFFRASGGCKKKVSGPSGSTPYSRHCHTPVGPHLAPVTNNNETKQIKINFKVKGNNRSSIVGWMLFVRRTERWESQYYR